MITAPDEKKEPALPALGCPEDCNFPHFVKDFARLQGVDPVTVWRWKREGMPYAKRTRRVYCKAARDWLKRNRPRRSRPRRKTGRNKGSNRKRG